MAKFIYVFTGVERELFLSLPADPPTQWLEPGDKVTCTEAVEHARLELVGGKRRASSQADAATEGS